MMNNENIVSVILQDISGLIIGERYRFCLVLLQEKNIKRDLVVGCSNITKLEAFDNFSSSEDSSNYNSAEQTNYMAKNNQTNNEKVENVKNRNVSGNHVKQQISLTANSNNEKSEKELLMNSNKQQPSTGYKLLSSMNGSFLPGLAAGIFVTSLFVLIWGATKIRSEHHRRLANSSITTCYMASSNETPSSTRIINVPESDRGNQYLKLQATTNL